MAESMNICRGELKCHGVCGDGRCGTCGFNPAEKERRLRDGQICNVRIYHALHDDYGHIVHAVNKVCKTIVFKKGI